MTETEDPMTHDRPQGVIVEILCRLYDRGTLLSEFKWFRIVRGQACHCLVKQIGDMLDAMDQETSTQPGSVNYEKTPTG
jgi:hypothetical protein